MLEGKRIALDLALDGKLDAVAAALKLLNSEGPAFSEGSGFSQVKVIVIVFPDGGERYLSESFWSEAN